MTEEERKIRKRLRQREASKRYYARNKDKKKEYAEDNKEHKKEYMKKWQKDNKEELNEYNRNWNRKNPHVYTAKTAKYRATKKNATPSWANLKAIREFYKKCPKGYHVDHIIPLNGKTVSGLHVESNLQYLTIEDNLSKSNKF
jgi:hypothetical protein